MSGVGYMKQYKRYSWAALIAGMLVTNVNSADTYANDTLKHRTGSVLFDAGSSDHLQSGATKLGIETKYNKETGFGWVSSEQRALLDRKKLFKSRDLLTIDSVVSKRLEFKANVAPGNWQITFWVEAGMEDVTSMKFYAQGIEQPIEWVEFDEPSEPRTSLKQTYRLYMTNALVGDDGLSLEWVGDKDLVRLNGLQLMPHAEEPARLQDIKQYQIQLALRIKDAGRYNSRLSLEAIVNDIDKHLEDYPTDSYAAYWKHRLEILAQAENYYEGLRGWQWARKKTGLSMFGRYEQAIMLLDGLIASSEQGAPLYERALYQRGRLLYWLDREGHGNNYDGVAPADLKKLYELHPADNVLAMYSNVKIDTPDACDKIQHQSNAPAWATAQNEVLCRTRLLTHWWIHNRQDSNGELGGKYGDDVEMLRWWSIPYLAGDTLTGEGWKKLATGVWHSDRLEDGYFKKPADVEHASEPISDTAPLLSYLGDDEYIDRLGYSARHFLERWTAVNDAGRRYFKSAWFGALTIDERPPRNRDVPMNERAAKAVRYYAWFAKEEKTVKALHELAKAWAHAAMRTDKGKPVGIIPASVRWYDEAINGDEPTWYDANMFWSYFNWNHEAGQQIYDLLLFVSELTGDETLLEPMFKAADLISAYQQKVGVEKEADVGSERWAVERLSKVPAFWEILSQWRLLSDNTKYDALLKKFGGSYIKYRMTGDEGYLDSAAKPILKTIRYNTPMLTSEVLFTDRVYIARTDGGEDPTPQMLGMLTGGVSIASPYAEVTWEASPDGFTGLVSKATRDSLSVDTYLFNSSEQTIQFRPWRLEAGDYILKVVSANKQVLKKKVSIEQIGDLVSVSVKPNEKYTITLQKRR